MRRLFVTIFLWFWFTLIAVGVFTVFFFAHMGFGHTTLVRLTLHDLMVFSLAGGIFCYFISRHLTKPLYKLSEAAANIAEGRLDTRVDPSLRNRRDEIAGLARNFDRMAERIEALITGQRRLLGDVSHELRSPLSRLIVALIDYDNDGWVDLFIANGHVYPEVEQISPETHYKQHNSLFHNEHNGKFKETTEAGGLTGLAARAGRGVAFADFDNDGYVDVIVANNGDPPTLLRNSGKHENHFVNFKLVGTKSNRDALGARIRVSSGKISQIREIAGGGSYLSQSDLRANFGLGDAALASSVEVTWPSGGRQVFHDVKADQFYLIEEGRAETRLQQIRGRNKVSVDTFKN